ncbi:hypothetical protein MTO96_038638 [Rhipicephalus appendiculatus]
MCGKDHAIADRNYKAKYKEPFIFKQRQSASIQEDQRQATPTVKEKSSLRSRSSGRRRTGCTSRGFTPTTSRSKSASKSRDSPNSVSWADKVRGSRPAETGESVQDTNEELEKLTAENTQVREMIAQLNAKIEQLSREGTTGKLQNSPPTAVANSDIQVAKDRMEITTSPLKRKADIQKTEESQVPRQDLTEKQSRLDIIEKKNGTEDYITKPLPPFCRPSDWPHRPPLPTPLKLEASALFVRQHGATSLICPVDKGVIPAIDVEHGTTAMHQRQRIPLVQVLLMLIMGQLPTRPWNFHGPTTYAWKKDVGAYTTKRFTPFRMPSDWPHRPSPPTQLMLDVSVLLVSQHGATSLICPIWFWTTTLLLCTDAHAYRFYRLVT